MSQLVVGTAGHIDHGKSALVEALTGVDPDRLAEEKRRGITIELGFADAEIDGRRISFVDVPGHERFVRQMVAGASGIDAVLLVVAADQGVQPQTREHLAICRLLDVRRGVVALTKCDLVDPELAQVAALELTELLEGTFLDGAPLVAVSARDGRGLEELRSALGALAAASRVRDVDGPARLPVDRAFVMRGFGTVVTGTLRSGTLREGDELQVLPGATRARVRGVQVHGETVRDAAAGRRVAVNLQGVEQHEVPRGATLCRPGELLETRRVWARVRLLPAAPPRLARGGPVRLHLGTADVGARLRRLGEEGEEGETLLVELHAETPLVALPGDRFILRRPAPVDTVGGGTVVDAHPPRWRPGERAAFAEGALEPAAAIALRVARGALAGLEPATLGPRLGLDARRLEEAIAALVERGALVRAGGSLIDAAAWEDLGGRLVTALEAYHRDRPLHDGRSRESLRGELAPSMAQDAWRARLAAAEREGRIRLAGELVAAAGHRVELGEAARRLAASIEGAARDAGYEPASRDELLPDDPAAAAVLEHLVTSGRLVRLADGRLAHRETVERLVALVRERAAAGETALDVAAFKTLTGVSRKYAIPLLEHLDSIGVTRRVGQSRVVLGAGPS